MVGQPTDAVQPVPAIPQEVAETGGSPDRSSGCMPREGTHLGLNEDFPLVDLGVVGEGTAVTLVELEGEDIGDKSAAGDPDEEASEGSEDDGAAGELEQPVREGIDSEVVSSGQVEEFGSENHDGAQENDEEDGEGDGWRGADDNGGGDQGKRKSRGDDNGVDSGEAGPETNERADASTGLSDDEAATARSSGSSASESNSSESSSDGSEAEVEIVGVRAAPVEGGVWTRSQAKNQGRRVPPPPKASTKQKPTTAFEFVETEFYRVVDRRKGDRSLQNEYLVVWKTGGDTWVEENLLREDDLHQHLDIVDRWIVHKEAVARKNEGQPENQRVKVMDFARYFQSDIGALRFMGANERYDCMFQAVRFIFEEQFGWIMCFSDDDVDEFKRTKEIKDRGVTFEEFLGFLYAVLRKVWKERRECLDIDRLGTNLFHGKGTKLEGLIGLDLEDGWYLCGAIDSTRTGHAFPLKVEDGLWQVRGDDGDYAGLGSQDWIFRMSFVRRIAQGEVPEKRQGEATAPKHRRRAPRMRTFLW